MHDTSSCTSISCRRRRKSVPSSRASLSQEHVELKTVASISAARPRIFSSPRSSAASQRGLRAARRRRPADRVAFADHADAVPPTEPSMPSARALHRSLLRGRPLAAATSTVRRHPHRRGDQARNARAIANCSPRRQEIRLRHRCHVLECASPRTLGRVKLSRERGQCVLHVDVGGGTTKLASSTAAPC